MHQKCNPRCAFLHTLTSKAKSSVDIPNRSNIPDLLSLGVQQSNFTLEFPDYADQGTRLQSFKYWGGVLPKEELAEAGFYMIARRDVVRCFSCHVVLQDWEKTDNVIEEHQRHSPECAFLKEYLFANSSKSNQSSLGTTTTVSKEVSTTLQRRLDSMQINPSKINPVSIEKSELPQSPQSPEKPLGIIYPLRSNPSGNIVNESGEDIESTGSRDSVKEDYTVMTSLQTTKQNMVS